MSPANPQQQTPLLDALRDRTNHHHSPFYAPGHKRGQGISQPLVDLFGAAVFRSDLPELPELDNLFNPEGAIAQAQELAAQAFEADSTRFLANGSTCGIIAAIVATCGPGDKIILPRNIHSSAISGLILSGAMPIFVSPEYDRTWDIANSITPEAAAAALEQHSDAKAVMVVYPTYHGVCGDLRAIAKITHQYNIPLLVDEAHGAHFNFHPNLPAPALSAGADLTVQSIHKTLGAMTQASMLHVKGDRINIQKVDRALQLVQSTSPSYLLLASLDAARQQIALHGNELMAQTLDLAAKARSHISQIPGLSVLEQLNTRGFAALDRTRLTVKVSDLGITGFAADEILHSEFAVTAELPMPQHLTFIISLGNTESDIDNLVKAFTLLAERSKFGSGLCSGFNGFNGFMFKEEARSKKQDVSPLPLSPTPPISPREAFFSPTETVAADKAVDRTSAELICPYPPGIPVLMPGEIITQTALDYLQHILAAGGKITGCSDRSLQTLRIVAK
ncbi:MAG: aminotransferase class I/II-fold pyridoxal phosphate-dependent enzyme [Microcoleus sp. PH2017_10_PVI_O_A]|uniref:aminotransferase class I/II-fold pyridoxal phosphate-dependent enzyme n=1 Tax=unclassified Microcoleus TaxID=2642155 RepID=UPI001D8D9F48|nr:MULTISPECIES: aminotransferase class I/II-fold pyridoxal phosphate-dependent enzyme [unclassified Microcoleus]TAE81324.1 MAG: aminotransferase class I/II-fold pyridoxal phosphate-dependent enzyme [Oscillatoriales cyanobacterium]MCC3405400.1 aminotransferase class I/II-fold pyridoxal phosphate-dependent enzyme [Microcoleus sp. PH2017_10_PVI_O_A]MCC3459392.1 aminotransferase class I/II-fold pyridoxal phosphate-dependent enzyme [Microcoleus sp. PH2017_11_PCY_U_A]MCC3477673.1 aminotransferase cl